MLSPDCDQCPSHCGVGGIWAVISVKRRGPAQRLIGGGHVVNRDVYKSSQMLSHYYSEKAPIRAFFLIKV